MTGYPRALNKAQQTSPSLDATDRRIIVATQAGLPLEVPAAAGPASPPSAIPAASPRASPAARAVDPHGVFALSYIRFWMAGGPCVNPCGLDIVPNSFFDQDIMVFLCPCSPESNEEELVLDSPDGPEFVVEDEDMSGDWSIEVVFDDRA